MTAMDYPFADHVAPTVASGVQGGFSAWLGTACRLSLLVILVTMHLPMLVFFGGIIVLGRILKKKA